LDPKLVAQRLVGMTHIDRQPTGQDFETLTAKDNLACKKSCKTEPGTGEKRH
jgi:hypothetical protein